MSTGTVGSNSFDRFLQVFHYKESTCNAEDMGDTGLVPRLGRSPGGGNGNPVQHFRLKISRCSFSFPWIFTFL